ncbi:glycine-rich domain-containing protein [Paracoccus litorisediminis]|uniref:glycine-rich domain-containing protein n=1 Tax=Paracoccus litorisediminis TaxID=2006130 RepID=UPI00372EDAB5
MRSALPLLQVTGGVITSFNRSGVDYVEVLWLTSGGLLVSADVPVHRSALGAGGATGGRGSGTVYLPGAGGAGGLIKAIDVPLLAGNYSIAIGAGGAEITTGVSANSGSNSVLTNLTTSTVLTAIGGGWGAISGSWNLAGNGGSGGGARAQNGATGVNTAFGTGVAGQGYDGGRGNSSSTPENAASGGSGGAGGPGGDASAGVAGLAGLGEYLDWVASPLWVCQGERGLLLTDNNIASAGKTFGSGSRGAMNANVGKGGDGFRFLRVRADQADVRMAA